MFLSTVSQRLRQPLDEIAALCREMQTGGADIEPIADRIRQAGGELAELVEQVLEAAMGEPP